MSGVPPVGLGGVRRPTQRSESGLEPHPRSERDQKDQPKVWKGSRGQHGGLGGVGGPTRRSGRDRDRSGCPLEGSGGVKRPTRRFGRGRENQPKDQEG